jgi:hypothetical protein
MRIDEAGEGDAVGAVENGRSLKVFFVDVFMNLFILSDLLDYSVSDENR